MIGALLSVGAAAAGGTRARPKQNATAALGRLPPPQPLQPRGFHVFAAEAASGPASGHLMEGRAVIRRPPRLAAAPATASTATAKANALLPTPTERLIEQVRAAV